MFCRFGTRCIAMPIAPDDCPVKNTSAILSAQPNFPSEWLLPQSILSGVVEQPRLRTRKLSAAQFRLPIASTIATVIGLLAHIPPSINGVPQSSRCVGKYVGAAAVDIATSTARLL